jgi:hypothetical protein
MMASVFVGDVGTEIVLDCGISIVTATAMQIAVKKPDGRRVLWLANIDGVQGLKHVTQAGDLDIPGVYKLQAQVVMPGWSGSGEVATMNVISPL